MVNSRFEVVLRIWRGAWRSRSLPLRTVCNSNNIILALDIPPRSLHYVYNAKIATRTPGRGLSGLSYGFFLFYRAIVLLLCSSKREEIISRIFSSWNMPWWSTLCWLFFLSILLFSKIAAPWISLRVNEDKLSFNLSKRIPPHHHRLIEPT